MVRAGTRGYEADGTSGERPAGLQGRTGQRARTLRSAAAALCATLVVCAALLLQGATAEAEVNAPLEFDGIWLINQTRGARGLGAVGQDPWLTILARIHADRLASDNRLYHQDLSVALTWGWRWVGENVAFSSAGLVDAHRALENSPGHLANMVAPGAVAAGVGVAWGSNKMFEVQLLAS